VVHHGKLARTRASDHPRRARGGASRRGDGPEAVGSEPGGFATDWAGNSMRILPSNPDYEATVGETAKRLRGDPGAARGVPEKAAQALLALASMPKQPRRLVLGTDAYVLAKTKALELIASDDAHRELSASTDSDGLPDFADTEAGRAILSLGRR